MKQSKKTILYIRTDLGTQDLIGGGSVAHTLGVVKGLLDDDYRVICASSAMHSLLSNIKHQNYSFIPLVVPAICKVAGFKIASLISNLLFYHKIEKFIKDHKIDFIYQRYSMLNVVGVWLHQQYKIPFILEFNGSEVWVDKNWSAGKLRLSSLLNKIERYNLEHAQKIIVVSQVLKRQLMAVGIAADKIEINPNGVDIDQFDPSTLVQERMIIRKKLGIDDKFVIGFASTFGPWHGVDLLAYVMPRVVRQEPSAHFLLIGDGQLKEQLMAVTKDEQIGYAVTFTGMLHAQEMPAYLVACDAFICPTQPNKDGTPFFGSPTKLFEYMAMGKPIIASDIEQVAQLLDIEGNKALLVVPTDYDRFCEVVLKVIAMHADERQVVTAALHKQVQQYTWQAHVERIVGLMHELL